MWRQRNRFPVLAKPCRFAAAFLLTFLTLATCVVAAEDPRPKILVIGDDNACAWDSGLAWPDLLVEERLDWDVEIEARPEWRLADILANIDQILAAHPNPSVVVIATGTMEASVREWSKHDDESLGEMMRQTVKRIQAACPQTTPVAMTPLPVVTARMRNLGKTLFGPDGEERCHKISEAFKSAAADTGAKIVDLHTYAWKMNRRPNSEEPPGTPGFVMGTLGYEIRDWGPPFIVPWIAEQLDTIGPKASDPAAYEKWLTAWKEQQEAGRSIKDGVVSHGPGLPALGPTSATVPVDLLRGPTLNLLIKAKDGKADFQPCVSNKYDDLAAAAPVLTVQTNSGPVEIEVQPGHWQIIREDQPETAVRVYDFYDTAHHQQYYFARANATPGERMWVLTRFLLGDLAGSQIKEAEVAFRVRRRSAGVTIHPVLGYDVHWHPNKATWKTRDGVIAWSGKPDGSPKISFAQADPAPSHGAFSAVEYTGSVSSGPAEQVAEVKPISRKEAIATARATIARQLAEHGGGNWDTWNTKLASFRADLSQIMQGKWPWPAKYDFIFQGSAIRLMLMDAVDTELDGTGALDLIVDLNRQLAKMDIDLILVLIPDKVAIYPDYLSDKTPPSRAVNVAALRLMHDLLKHDVEVIDLFTDFREYRDRSNPLPLYYSDDSHWLNFAAERTAKLLGPRLRRYDCVNQSLAEKPRYVASETMRTDKKADVLRQIRQKQGGAYRGDKSSPVVLTGDSFSMYNQHLSADLAAQIAYEINMPVNHLCRAGFNAKDAALALASKPETLNGPRVIVVTFISRALSDCADWTPIPIRAKSVAQADTIRELPVTGKVASMSEPPPQRSEYLDYFMQFHITDLRDAQGRKVGSGEGVVHVLAVKNKIALPVAKTKVGDTFKMALTSWSLVEKAYGKIQRGTLDDLDVLLDGTYYYGHLEGQKETPRADKF